MMTIGIFTGLQSGRPEISSTLNQVHFAPPRHQTQRNPDHEPFPQPLRTGPQRPDGQESQKIQKVT